MDTLQHRVKNVIDSTKNVSPSRGRTGPVLYWMCRDQRVHDNWALLYAQQLAQQKKLPFGLVFCLTGALPYATARHHHFMIKGLQDVVKHCIKLNVPLWLLPPEQGCVSTALPKLTKELQSATVVTDIMPLRYRNQWIEKMKAPLEKDGVTLIEVDAHNVVPLWVTSQKQEWAARTIRPKITGCLPKYLTDIPAVGKQSTSVWPATQLCGPKPITSPDELEKYLPGSPQADAKSIGLLVKFPEVLPVQWIIPGEDAARKALQTFIFAKLRRYNEDRNKPELSATSALSPYFHFGHLSPQRAAYEVKHSKCASDAVAAFIEEAVVRRELSDNFTYYNLEYDRPSGMPNWAVASLEDHAPDKREYLYTQSQLEQAKTHDDLWNAAQEQLVSKGHMHGFMRMYWAKKILEWTPTAEVAYRYALMLNDKYSLDGNDPNGFVGVAWSIYGVHDMGWTERPIFGKVRFMNYAGCKRKFSIPAFIDSVRSETSAEKKKTFFEPKPTKAKGPVILPNLTKRSRSL